MPSLSTAETPSLQVGQNVKTHFIVTSIGTYGDIFPFAQVAIALQKTGHKVTFITNPYFEDIIHNCGLTFQPIGTKEQYMRVIMSEGLWNDQGFFDIVTSLFVPNLFVIDQFTAKLDPKEKIVILAHQNFLPNAGIAQSKRKNIKIICGALYPSIFRTSPKSIKIGSFTLPNILKKLAWYFLTKKDDRKYQTSPCIKLLNQVRKEQGLSPIKSYTDLFDRIASLNALLFSSWFGPTHHEWPKNIIQG